MRAIALEELDILVRVFSEMTQTWVLLGNRKPRKRGTDVRVLAAKQLEVMQIWSESSSPGGWSSGYLQPELQKDLRL